MRQTTTLTAISVGLILTVITLSSFIATEGQIAIAGSVQRPHPDDDAKVNALRVLQLKCNTCHVRQNPGKVFTAANMNTLASKINEQVFVKKRMPRGKRLSKEEYTILRDWIYTQNIK